MLIISRLLFSAVFNAIELKPPVLLIIFIFIFRRNYKYDASSSLSDFPCSQNITFITGK